MHNTGQSLLGSLATAPLDSEATRSLLQRRMTFLAMVFVIMVGSFHAIARLVRLQHPDVLQSVMGKQLMAVQFCVLLGGVIIWARLRSGKRGNFELRVLDALLVLGPPFAIAFSIRDVRPFVRPELLLLVVIAHASMLRSVLVPSSPRRTLAMTLTLVVPLPFATHFYYDTHTAPDLPPGWMFVVVVSAWGSATAVMSTLISYTIYGLRQRVLEATQLGQYTLEEKIGAGGMGTVYRARHALLRRPTAIKLMSAEVADERELLRFEREVQLTSQLSHPHTIAIYDYGRTPEGVFYYAMEYLQGLNLQQWVERSGPPPIACVLHTLQQVSGALAEAHGRGLVHRDIKPANIIVCERGGVPGFVKVVDFGLVKHLTHADGNVQLSNTQAIMGTPLYLSPEAIASPEQVDGRSDLYALGAVAHFLLTGRPVFEASSIVAVCAHHLHTPPTPPSAHKVGIPEELDALVLKLLAKQPEQRYASAQALRHALAAVQLKYPWSDDDAGAYWAQLQGQKSAAPAQPPGHSLTLAVDLRERAS